MFDFCNSQVYKVGSLSEDTLENYFEHAQSGGDTVDQIQLNTAEGYALVYFTQYGGIFVYCLNSANHSGSRVEVMQ